MNDNYEKERQQLGKMLKNCPDILKPLEARKWMPIGKNAIYDSIKSGELEAYVYKGGYIISKDAVIDYILRTSKNVTRKIALAGRKNAK